MIERINVQAFIFTRRPNLQLLILKRVPEKSGYWQPVCGGVEGDEEYKDTVIREIFEETGITEVKHIIDIGYSFTYSETKNGKLMYMQDICFAAEVNDILDIKLSREHEKYMWCSEEEAKQYLQWEHNLIALDKLLNTVNIDS